MSRINVSDNGENQRLKNPDNVCKILNVSSEQIKNALKSPGHKKIKPTQSNTLTGWLTKDLSHCKPSKPSREEVFKEIREHNVDTEFKTIKENPKEEKTSPSLNISTGTSKRKKKKKRKSEKRKDTTEDKDNITREKFKNIVTSPLSPKNLQIKTEYDKNKNSHSYSLPRWLSKYDSTSNSHIDIQETFDKKECNENIDSLKPTTMEENISQARKQIKENESELKSNGFKKHKEKSLGSNFGIKCDTKRKETDVSPVKQSSSSTSEVKKSTNDIQKGHNVDTIMSAKTSKSTNPAAVISGARKLLDIDLFSQSPTANVWLKKHVPSSKLLSKKSDTKHKEKKDMKHKKYKKLDVKIKQNRVDNDKSTDKNKSEKKISVNALERYLNNFTKESSKRKFSRSDSNNCEPALPKNNKKQKTRRSSESFKKYGVNIPSVEEIIKDQKDFAEYKNQIESFKDIEDQCFELPFSIKDLKQSPVIERNILGCKHLSLDDIEKVYNKNLDYISAIFRGEEYSERHERFFEKDVKNYTFTLKDLCYNTSTIVFTFEQMEHLIGLLKRDFDPDDKWTSYFFQVLLPELCLRIFMDTHSMTYEEAVKYLDTRPIED